MIALSAPIDQNYSKLNYTAMKHFNLLKSLLLLCALIVGSLSSWADDGDKHDFTQSLQQLLNNNATISSINIAQQDYPVKEVIVSYRYNNTKTDAVTMEVNVGNSSWGTFNVNGTGSNYFTTSFEGNPTIGGISISFTNNTGSGTGHGTFYVNKVQLVEGASTSLSPLSSIALSGSYPTTFTEGEAFSHEGMVVTATYDDTSTKNVTTSATFSGYDMSSVGNQEVTVSYTEGNITKTANYGIVVNALPKYTVSFSDGGSVTQASYGAKVTLPTRPAISSYTFAGWSETNVLDETTTAPTIIPAGDYTPAADITMYPVYSKTEGASGVQNKTASVTISAYALANSWTSGSKYTTIEADENVTIEGANNGNNSKFYNTSSPHNWRFYASDNGSFTITTTNGVLTSTTITYTGNKLKYNNNDVTSATPIPVSGTSATFEVSGSNNNSQVSAIEVNYTIGNQGTTYYWSAPVAATVERPEITFAANPFTFSTTATITCATGGADIKYSYDGENWSDYTTPLTITETKTIYAKAVLNSDESQVASVTATKNLVEPTVTIDATGITNTNVFAGTDAGSLSASVTYNEVAVEGAAVTWSGNNDAVATINASTGAVTLVGAGSVTFTATYARNSDYSEKTATYEMTVVNDNPNAPGKQSNPYTVAQARAAIDAGEGVAGVYATGIVSEIVTAYNSQYGNISYNISVDGKTTSDQLQAYRGKSYNGDNFTSADDIQIGDVVVIYGNLKKHNSTYEFDQNNQLVSRVTKTAPTFALDVKEKTLDAYTHETVDVTLTTNTDGDVTCESSNPDVATVALKSAGVYTITAQSEGSATITIKSATSATYKPASASVAVTVEDGRADAGISFAETEIEKTWGESFTGQALSNTNSVDVTYSSTDESVATVSSTGVVTVLKAGSTTIKATFAGNATYKAYVASYDLTINKAEAGLSYSENTFDVVLGDKNFVAPVLNNPNGLTVTYSSNNTNVASVDENTGDVVLDASAEATVTITATFAGNDNFKTGSTNYTINIIDPNKKGSKLNPYTVAEVREVSTTTTIKDVYVEGYIVGYVNSTYGFTSSTSSFTNTNWAIADSKNETEADNSAPVQITGTSIQSLYGLANHKDLVGAKVLIKGDITKYFNVSGIKNLDEFNVEKEVAISAAGWATYCSSNALDFTGITALTAYTASKDGDVVKFNKVTGKVPANTGLLVRGETANVPVCASAEAVQNLLVGVTAEEVKDANTVFVLMKGSKGIGFYKNTNAFTLRANSAYLPAEAVAGASARSFIALDDETTGIADVKAVKEDAEGMFDLQGRKIVKPTKGLYVVNGKKVVVK